MGPAIKFMENVHPNIYLFADFSKQTLPESELQEFLIKKLEEIEVPKEVWESINKGIGSNHPLAKLCERKIKELEGGKKDV